MVMIGVHLCTAVCMAVCEDVHALQPAASDRICLAIWSWPPRISGWSRLRSPCAAAPSCSDEICDRIA